MTSAFFIFKKAVRNLMKTETRLCYEVETDCAPSDTAALVLAAGNSSRMGGIQKIFADLCGVPVIIRTLQAFEESPLIGSIILTARSEDIFALQALTHRFGITKLRDIVCGGESRQESAAKGIAMADRSVNKVLIHDGARPLVTQRMIADTVKALDHAPGVCCAVPVKDTVKRLNTDQTVAETPDRSALVLAQTPQGVLKGDYLDAVAKADNLSRFTDDVSLLEAAGKTVLTVPGDPKNIKITTPEDLLLAEMFLKEEFPCE